jgi:hypothetical protein
MLRRSFLPMTIALLGGGLLPSAHAGEAAYIPASADTGSIRFEKVRMVTVPSRIAFHSDRCGEMAFRDPGGSIVCPQERVLESAKAYEVTYSYLGAPLESDQSAGRSFTFRVRFRPEELPADMQKALATRKLSRTDQAAYFAVTASRQSVGVAAIDGQRSRFCAGNYVDGQWARTDPGCRDTLSYRTVTEPSGYLTVRVEPVSPLVAGPALAPAR